MSDEVKKSPPVPVDVRREQLLKKSNAELAEMDKSGQLSREEHNVFFAQGRIPSRANLRSAKEIAVGKSEPQSPSPETDALVKELFRTTGGTKKHFSDKLLPRPTILNKAALIDLMTFEMLPNELEALREQPGQQPDPEQDVYALWTPIELEVLKDIQSRADGLREKLAPFALTNLDNRIAEIRDAHDQAIANGTTPEQLVPTREALFKDNLAKFRAFEKLLHNLWHQEAAPIVATILWRLDEVVIKFLRRIEIADREDCATKGLAYEPSLEWRAAGHFLLSQRVVMPGMHAWTTPKEVLKNIIEL